MKYLLMKVSKESHQSLSYCRIIVEHSSPLSLKEGRQLMKTKNRSSESQYSHFFLRPIKWNNKNKQYAKNQNKSNSTVSK